MLQIGSYYGSEITSVDTDGDGVTDILLVGAPMYFSEGRERGRVYVYSLSQVLLRGAGQLPRGPSPLPDSGLQEGNWVTGGASTRPLPGQGEQDGLRHPA